MKKTIIAVLLLLSITSIKAQYVPNSWTLLNATGGFQNGSYFPAFFAIGNSIYVAPGATSAGYTKEFWEYNTVTKQWTQRNPLPGPARGDAVGFALRGKGYIGGGHDASNNFTDFYQYDPSTGTWTTAGSLPTTDVTTSNAMSFTLNYNGKDYGYICGGANALPPYSYTNALYQYDPNSGQWSSKSSLPENRAQAVSFVINNTAYVGTGGTSPSNPTSNSFISYDPSQDKWSLAPSIPGIPRNGAVGFSIGQYGYVGLAGDKNFFQFDGVSKTWNTNVSYVTQFPGLLTGGGVGVSICGNPSYGFVGSWHVATTWTNDIYQYSPPNQYSGLCPWIPTGIDLVGFSESKIVLFPNPSKGRINLEITTAIKSPINYSVFDINGKLIVSGETQNPSLELDNLKPGIYNIQLMLSEKAIVNKKFIIEE